MLINKITSERTQLFAISALFMILGASFATWASRIPAIREISELTPATLGYALLGKGAGTLLIMPVVAILINKIGAKKSSLIFGIGVVLTLIPMTISPDWKILTLVLFAAGISGGGLNVSMNALASKLETDSGRSYMSFAHSFFGVGILLGALLGTVMAGTEFSVSVHFWGMAFVLLILLSLCYSFLPTEKTDSARKRPGLQLPRGNIIWLGILCFLAASIEDSITNWVALFFTDYVNASESVAPAGYVAYAGSMLIMRFFGDRLKPKFGAQMLISVGSFAAAAGIVISLLVPEVTIATIGFIAAGAGVALTFPLIFSAAGRQGASALASVVTMGSLGGLISQPVMGLLVENFELMGGFLFIGICMLAVGAGCWKATSLSK